MTKFGFGRLINLITGNHGDSAKEIASKDLIEAENWTGDRGDLRGEKEIIESDGQHECGHKIGILENFISSFDLVGQPKRDGNIDSTDPNGYEKIVDAHFAGEKHSPTSGNNTDRTLGVYWCNK